MKRIPHTNDFRCGGFPEASFRCFLFFDFSDSF